MADDSSSTKYELLDLSTFVTRFGGVDAKQPVLRRLHGLFAERTLANATVAGEWLEDLAGWLFERGRVPGRRAGEDEVAARTRVLFDVLDESLKAREMLKAAVALVIGSTNAVRLFTDVGVPSQHGFWRELLDRVVGNVLPQRPVGDDFSRLVQRLVPSAREAGWALELPSAQRLKLTGFLGIGPSEEAAWVEPALLEAAVLLVARISMQGTTAELRRRVPGASVLASPWLELAHSTREAVLGQSQLDSVIEVLARCRVQLTQVERSLEHTGISVELVFRLELLRALLTRLELVLTCALGDEAAQQVAWLALEKSIVGGVVTDRSVGALWARNTQLLARRMVERAGDSGEHYITRTRAEQHSMLTSAAGGGAITAVLVVVKFVIGWSGLPPLIDALAVGANYAMGFVAMQFAHFSLATKQPAMTAATLAGSIEAAEQGKVTDFEPLVDQVARASRTQLAALAGNVGMVLPLAVLFDVVLWLIAGHHVLDEATALKVVKTHHPFHSVTLFSAAMTGVWLWAASLIAGAVENWFVLHEMPGAIAGNRLLRRLVGSERASRFSTGVTRSISGLGGNIGFGMLLGLMPFIAKQVGIPLEVRHVTFVAGQVGYAGMFLGAEAVLTQGFLMAVLSIPLVAAFNFAVSFALALVIALRARGLGLKSQLRLLVAVIRRLVRHPKAFVFAPLEPASLEARV